MAEQDTLSLPKRLPLVIEPENRGDSDRFDARLVNAYMEKGKSEGEYWIYERPGLEEDSRPPAADATGRGMFNWRSDIYSIFGDKLYKNGSAVSGTVNTTNGNYRFDSTLGSTPKLQLGDGVTAYNYDDSNGLVEITDGDFPAAFRKGWAYLNGTTYVGTATANLLGSDINDPVNWDALNVILAQIEPDQGVAVSKQLVYVVFFKEWTTEIFYDAGNASGSPLGRVEGAKVNWGCLAQDSVRELDGALFWLGVTRNGSPEVVMLDNLKADAISTKPIERLLTGVTASGIYSWTLKLDGHRFYVLTSTALNLTLAFDLDQRMWSQWTDEDGNYLPIVDSCADGTTQLVQHASNGRIYEMASSHATDDGELIQVDIYTPNFDGGVRRRKSLFRLEMISDQLAGSEMLVRHNERDFAETAWSNWRRMDLSKKRPYLDNCGTFYRRAYNFRHRQPVRMPRIQAMELQMALGAL